MKSVAATVAVLTVAGAVAWGAADGGARVGPVPVIVLCAVIAFAVQWVAFVPAYLKQTERFYDLVGSLTYLTVVWTAVALGNGGARAYGLAGLATVWAARLGTFLFRRIGKDGGDGRFDDIKPNAGRFFVAWTLQGLWVFLTLCAALAAITDAAPAGLSGWDLVGVAIWVVGFAIEVVADQQKRAFRATNPGEFIHTGLWAWSRHPNYFGEITLWTGVAVSAAATLDGWAWVTLVSPIFVYLLLTRISGVPLLEKRADDRWGGQPDYEAYKARTPVLMLRAPRGAA